MPKKIQFKIDEIGIEKAREEFKKRNFKGSLNFYNAINYKTSFQNLDLQIIEYCARQIRNININ